LNDFALLTAGIVLAALGGEVFVRGAVGLASRLRVPVGIVGVTVAAFATSTPEMAVGVNAAVAGTPQIAAGDALGSNVVNIALVMGAALLVVPLSLGHQDVRRDLPFAIAAPFILGLLTLDGWLSRIDGAVLVTVFLAWIGTTVRGAMRARDSTPTSGDSRAMVAVFMVLFGIVLLLVAGRLVVVAAEGIGYMFDMDPFLVGATLVALGTSMPELATAIVSRLRGHGELGVGTVMGSNIFNSLWIVGGIALFRPFSLRLDEVGVAVIAGAVAALLLLPTRSFVLGRRRGALLIMGYIAYLGALVARTG